MRKAVKNLAESVHVKLNNLAKSEERTFQELFYYYAIERFLFRLSNSPHVNSFTLKGGLAFLGWGIALRRPTRDIDVQGYGENSIENLMKVVKEICIQNVIPDGMQFDPDSVRGERILDEAEYPGVRIYFSGSLGNATIQLHMDVSFANPIIPQVILVDYPSLLGMPTIKMSCYPYETAIAEKFQAMVALDSINDRMKDFYDIWLLSQQVDIPGSTLVSAVKATFQARNTPLPKAIPTALTSGFAMLRQSDWERFLKRSRLNLHEYLSLNETIAVIREFLWPIVQAADNNMSFESIWTARGPWRAA